MSRFNSPFSRSLLLPLTALLVLGCGSRGPVSAGGGEAEARSGIQTRSIRSAPAAERARNESKPLSELNTPDAIAAREAAARSAGPAARSTTRKSTTVFATSKLISKVKRTASSHGPKWERA